MELDTTVKHVRGGSKHYKVELNARPGRLYRAEKKFHRKRNDPALTPHGKLNSFNKFRGDVQPWT